MADYVKKMREGQARDSIINGRIVDQYRVFGPTTKLLALAAVDTDTGQRVPKRNDPLDEDNEFRVIDRDCVWQGISADKGNVWIATVEYHKPQFEFILNSLEWKWEPELLSVPASVDHFGRALLNSAQIPVVGTYSKPVFVLSLYVWFNAVFSPALAKAVANKVNTSAMTIFNGTAEAFSIDSGNMLCRTFRPIAVQQSAGNTQRIEAVFSFQDGSYPWYLHAPDQSFSGWYSSSGTAKSGNFLNSAGDEVAEPILLNGSGVPLLSGYTVGGQTPAGPPAVPTWVNYRLSSGGTYEAIFETLGNYEFSGFISGVM